MLILYYTLTMIYQMISQSKKHKAFRNAFVLFVLLCGILF